VTCQLLARMINPAPATLRSNGDYDAVTSKLPETMRRPPEPSPADLRSFAGYRDWQLRTQGIAFPEAELRSEFSQNPMEVSGITQYLGLYQKPLWRGDHKHDYSQIRVPVLAFLCLRSWDIQNFPKTRYGKTI